MHTKNYFLVLKILWWRNISLHWSVVVLRCEKKEKERKEKAQHIHQTQGF